ncbi:Anticodon-binding [Pseudocohnilembus persalinus]|uniref:Histidine--tRNA ligase, cytoplasmic n=1 Tax=Pseudocohnilembus persalinus TaxID=266149 RepID=A0A0V0QYU7_PSEPJ|nr:Anticodon-binding [Pseudocohnilembus persalinus]|eukprot:KRX07061.1 Anticodon-binding [Pseudocohnilembus persalinus]
MKFVGRINLSKQELVDIIFKSETVALDPQTLDKYSKKNFNIDYQKVLEIISQQGLLAQKSEETLFNQSNFSDDQHFIRALLVILLLQLVSKKGATRIETAQFLVTLINAGTGVLDLTLSSSQYSTQPWQIMDIFYENSVQSERIKKVEGFTAFPQLSESESQLIINNLEKIYLFSIALNKLQSINKIISLSTISYSFYCESLNINTEFLQIYEKKTTFARNISIVASVIQNLLNNSTLKKAQPSSDDTTWVELLGQTRFNFIQLQNLIIEELGVEDSEGLKLKGNFERTFQTLNNLSLQLAGSIATQLENTLQRNALINESEQQEYIKEKLQSAQEVTGQLLNSLNFMPKEKGFCKSSPYLMNLHEYYGPLLDLISLEMKTRKRFGLGTAQIFELFSNSVSFDEETLPQENYQKLVESFFNLNNKDLLAKFEEITISKNSERRKVKVPKGTQDFGGKEMAVRRNIFNTVTEVFRSHGAVEIDTPVFELKETLTGKYGEDSKLIYDLEDQGGELLSLRYDLTVPFARFMAMQNKLSIKRYQMQKVYRRDQPNIQKGRYREFNQCDFDISGKGDIMMQDAEVIQVFNTILNKLKLDKFLIKINNRKILDAMIEISGAPMSKFKPICSAIDKLDKETWDTVKKELIEEKGIDPKSVEILGTFVNGVYTGKPMEVLQKLISSEALKGSSKGEEALKEMEQLFKYLTQLGAISNVSFDLSLARGLDYYTGMIFEIVLVGELVGSIAGGGRYDELIGMFMDKKDAVPSVGGSLGIERVYRILEQRKDIKKFTETEVLVCSIGALAEEKLQITGELWNAGINAEYLYKEKEKPQKQLEYAIYQNIPFAIFIGEEEIKNQQVGIRKLYLREQETVSRNDYIQYLKKAIEQYYVDAQNGKVEYYIEEEQKKQTKPEPKQEKK